MTSFTPRTMALLAMILMAMLWGCRNDGTADGDADGDSDGDADGDGDGDADGDGDGDSDGDADGDADGDPCSEGFTDCAGNCVDLQTDQDNCGICSRSCAEHELCIDGECVSNVDCREEPCPDGYYCNLAEGTCEPGCANDDGCGAHESCDTGSHECRCDSGYHRCGGLCVDSTSPDNCGARCEPCPDTDNGWATCISGSCGLDCDSGYLLCGGLCARCPADSHSDDFGCSGSECVVDDCDAGYHLCDGGCVSNTSPATCGSRCTPCPAPSHATATCVGGDCDFTCQSGYHRCGVACYSNTDAEHCGTDCERCPVPTGGVAECVGGECEQSCLGGDLLCGGECVDPDSDERHCGDCGEACATGSECRSGECVCLTDYTLGTFTRPESFGTVYGAAIGDVDGDGDLDIVTGGSTSTWSDSGAEIRTLLNNGDGTFADSLELAPAAGSTNYMRDVVLGNFYNDDDILDLAAFVREGTTTFHTYVHIYAGDGDGTFPTFAARATGWVTGNAGTPLMVAAPDLDSDGRQDIVAVANNGGGYEGFLRTSEQEPEGTFTPQYFDSIDGLRGASIGDWNADGRIDLFVTRPWGDCMALRGTTYFGYSEIGPIDCDGDSAAATGDLDGDSGDEVVVAAEHWESSVTTTRVTVYDYTGSSLSAGAVYDLEGDETYAAAWSDLDADGNGDVLLAYNDSGLTVRAMMGGGDGTLCAHDTQSVTGSPSIARLLTADLDEDGCMDIILVATYLYIAYGVCS